MPAHMTAKASPRPAKGAAAKLRRARRRLASVRFLANCQIVRERDGNRCRVCRSDHWIEVHHIVYRSRGGDDSVSNLICLCRRCHDAEHAHRLRLTGTSDALTVEAR